MTVVAVIIGILVASQDSPGARTTATSNEIVGLETFAVPSRNHVNGPVQYPQTPPVGGDHAPIWQDCGFYSRPIVTEQGVHSMEHGAVWITYRPDLPTDQVGTLRRLATDQTYILVSPWPGLSGPIVASAWGKQVQLESATDPRLAEFVRQFRESPKAPEPGAACVGGATSPA
ncbi:MAG: DUF3105 domain-containing protein [Actinomycetota bacterium]|nr:DUF3105 domain-containing protein [Actinomycetota bacterium]